MSAINLKAKEAIQFSFLFLLLALAKKGKTSQNKWIGINEGRIKYASQEENEWKKALRYDL